MTGRYLGLLAIVLAAILWGTTGTTQALLPAERSSLAVGALRVIVGAMALVMLALMAARSRRALAQVPLKLALTAGAAVTAYNLSFFGAVSAAGVGIGTAIAVGSAPIWATAFELIFQNRWPSRLTAIGQIIAVIGVVLLALTSGGASGSLLGITLALTAGASYAAYSLLSGSANPLIPSTALAAVTFSLAAVMSAPILLITPLTWLFEPGVWLTISFLGIGATGASYAFYTWGLKHVAASTAVTIALLEPVTAWVLALIVVGETLTTQSAAGVGLIMAGLVLVTLATARKID